MLNLEASFDTKKAMRFIDEELLPKLALYPVHKKLISKDAKVQAQASINDPVGSYKMLIEQFYSNTRALDTFNVFFPPHTKDLQYIKAFILSDIFKFAYDLNPQSTSEKVMDFLEITKIGFMMLKSPTYKAISQESIVDFYQQLLILINFDESQRSKKFFIEQVLQNPPVNAAYINLKNADQARLAWEGEFINNFWENLTMDSAPLLSILIDKTPFFNNKINYAQVIEKFYELILPLFPLQSNIESNKKIAARSAGNEKTFATSVDCAQKQTLAFFSSLNESTSNAVDLKNLDVEKIISIKSVLADTFTNEKEAYLKYRQGKVNSHVGDYKVDDFWNKFFNLNVFNNKSSLFSRVKKDVYLKFIDFGINAFVHNKSFYLLSHQDIAQIIVKMLDKALDENSSPSLSANQFRNNTYCLFHSTEFAKVLESMASSAGENCTYLKIFTSIKELINRDPYNFLMEMVPSIRFNNKTVDGSIDYNSVIGILSTAQKTNPQSSPILEKIKMFEYLTIIGEKQTMLSTIKAPSNSSSEKIKHKV